MATKNFFVNDGLKVKGNTLLNGNTYTDGASAKLHVKSAANGTGANLANVNGILIENSGTGNSNYALKLATGSGNIFNVSNAGNVGIGAVDATSIFHAVGPGSHPTALAHFDTQSIARFEADSSNAVSLYITEGADGSYLQVTDGTTDSSTAKDLNLQPFGGCVGIGTTNPSSPLHISSDANVVARFHSTDANATLYLSDNGTSNFSTFKRVSDNLAILENGGSVGIGTATPGSLLELYSSAPVLSITDGGAYGTNATSYIDFKDSSSVMSRVGVAGVAGTLDVDNLKANSIRLRTNGSTQVTVTSAGRVGIGYNSPTEKLFVKHGTVNTTIARFTGANNDRGLIIGTAISGSTNDSVVTFDAVSQNSVGQHAFKTDGTERVRIDESGNVGIGTTDPNEKLTVSGNLSASGTVYAGNAVIPGNITVCGTSTFHGSLCFLAAKPTTLCFKNILPPSLKKHDSKELLNVCIDPCRCHRPRGA